MGIGATYASSGSREEGDDVMIEIKGWQLTEFLTAEEVAARLRYRSASGIRSLVSTGALIPDGRGARNALLFLPETIEAFARGRHAKNEVPRGLPAPGRPVSNDLPVHRSANGPVAKTGSNMVSRDRSGSAAATPRVSAGRTRRDVATADAIVRIRRVLDRAKSG